MKNHFQNVTDAIEKINISLDKLRYANNCDGFKKDLEVYDNMDFELAKAFILDWEDVAVKAAKMILAHKDVNDIKIKIE